MKIPDLHMRKFRCGLGYVGANDVATEVLSEPSDFEPVAGAVTDSRFA